MNFFRHIPCEILSWKVPFILRTIGTFAYILKYLEYPDLKNILRFFKSTSRGCDSCTNGHSRLPGGNGRDGVKGEKGCGGGHQRGIGLVKVNR